MKLSDNPYELLRNSSEWGKMQENRPFFPLLVCESGSRAWGIWSPDSDYDIRFVYSFSQSDYLSLDNLPDTMTFDFPEYDIDAHGWDIRKYLRLMRKGNSAAFEWLYCPTYSYFGPWKRNTEDFAEIAFNPWNVAKHHYHLARQHTDRYIRASDGKVSIKKYLYVYRSLLSANYIINKRVMPPIHIADLLLGHITKDLDKKVVDVLNRIIDKKMSGDEQTVVPNNFVLDNDISKRLNDINNSMLLLEDHLNYPPVDMALFNDEFRAAVEWSTDNMLLA